MPKNILKKSAKINLTSLLKRVRGYKCDLELEQHRIKPLMEQVNSLKAKVESLLKSGQELSADTIDKVQEQFYEVDAEFTKVDKQFQGLDKKIDTLNKSHASKVIEVLKKPFEIRKGEEPYKTEIEAHAKWLTETLANTQQITNALKEKVILAKLSLEQIEHSVSTWALPGTLEKLAKLNERLNLQAEMTCKHTAEIAGKPLPKGFTPKKVSENFQLLFSLHKKGDGYLEQIQKNLGATFFENGKADKDQNVQKEEGKKPEDKPDGKKAEEKPEGKPEVKGP